MSLGFSDVEEEVVILKAVNEIIDSIINFELLILAGNDPDSSVQPRSLTHQRFFSIVLVDFLSCTDSRAPVTNRTYLDALRAISEHPSFDYEGSIEPLRDAASAFADWLGQEISVDIWLPSINKTGAILIPRRNFLKMCGNISKHNFLRLVGVAEELRKTLVTGGIAADLDDAMTALADFYERFHTDIFRYHVSTIAEFLNNIRWGIHRYLQPELLQCTTWEEGNPPIRRYRYPNTVARTFAQQCYWDLMNEVSREPYLRRFQVTKWLKQRY
jgi:hypothetical protein